MERPDEIVKLAEDMKQRLKVEELEENIDELEDVVEDVFPLLMFTALLCGFILVLFLVRLYLRWVVPNPSPNKLDGKTVLITGATAGIGKSTAIELAKRNARVFVTGREKAKVEAVARNIRRKTGNAHVNALVLDLSSLRNIREFAEDFIKAEKSLHVLINNAAYLGPPSKTDDGLERCLGVNYLGHYYLTHLLIDKLKKNAPSRIINVVSDTYTKGDLNLDDLALHKGYTPYAAYARSKLAQVVFNMECHRRYISSAIFSFGVIPGYTYTELLRNYPGWYGNVLRIYARIMFKPADDGCQTVVYCAVADGLRDFSGKLFTNCKVMRATDVVKDKALATKLFQVSAHLCGIEDNMIEEEEVAPIKAEGEEVVAAPEEKKEN